MSKKRHLRLLASLAAGFCLLTLGASFAGYRYLIGIDWYVPRVDAQELQARAQREQPVGGSGAETVDFLRNLGFEDRHILIRRVSVPGYTPSKLVSIDGWIPQPRCCLQPRQIRATCWFNEVQRLQRCTVTGRGSSLVPGDSGNWSQSTPVPAR